MTIWPQISIATDHEYSLCFCCGQNNPIGLKLSFQWDGKTARAEFRPTELYQGWPGLIHGGIIISILDEAMTYAALFEGKACVTAKIQVRLRRPVVVNEPLVIAASVTKKNKKLLGSQATLSLKDGTLVAEGVATQFVANPANGSLSPEAMSENNRKAVI